MIGAVHRAGQESLPGGAGEIFPMAWSAVLLPFLGYALPAAFGKEVLGMSWIGPDFLKALFICIALFLVVAAVASSRRLSSGPVHLLPMHLLNVYLLALALLGDGSMAMNYLFALVVSFASMILAYSASAAAVLRASVALCVLIAAASIALGVALPSFGLKHRMSGYVDLADKSLVGGTLLQGIYGHSNVLGIVCSFGLLIAVSQLRGRGRLVSFLVLGAAVVWASSRTALLALGVAALLRIVLRFVSSPAARAKMTALALTAIGLTVVLVPFVTRDPSAFSRRGYWWGVGMEIFREGSLLFGLGPRIGSMDALFGSYVGSTNYNAHNALIGALAAGGMLAGGLLIIGFGLAVRRSSSAARLGNTLPATLTAWLMVINLGDRGPFTTGWDPLLWVVLIGFIIIMRGDDSVTPSADLLPFDASCSSVRDRAFGGV